MADGTTKMQQNIEKLQADVEALQSLTEGGTGIVTGALKIETDADKNVTIGVIEEVFAPYDFSSLTDITA